MTALCRVGANVLLLAGPERARSPEPGRHFVGNEQHVVGLCQLAHSGQPARRMHENSRCPLDERFDDKAGDPSSMLNENPFQLGFAI